VESCEELHSFASTSHFQTGLIFVRKDGRTGKVAYLFVTASHFHVCLIFARIVHLEWSPPLEHALALLTRVEEDGSDEHTNTADY
jgi:hypothetical protein